MLVGAKGLNQSTVPFGAFAVNDGIVRTFSSTYDLVLVRSHPRSMKMEILNGLDGDFLRILQLMKRWRDGPEVLDVFYTRYRNLKVSTRHRRWAPLEPIGELVGNIFGLASTDDIRAIRDRINAVITVLGDNRQVIKDSIVLINDTRRQAAEVGSTVHSLIRRAEEVRQRIDMLVTNVTRLTDRTTKLYAYDVAEAILSAMEFYQTQEDAFERNYLHHREMAEIGHLTEGLIDEETLQEVLHRIHSPLPASYFYQHAKTHLLRMTSSKICYIISIPIIDADVYSAWKIATVPFLTQSGRGLAVIMPEASSVAVAHVSGSVIDTSTCIYEDPVLCWNPIRYTTMPCVQGIISKNPDLLDSCLLQATNNHLPTLKKLTVRQILVTTMGERIEERCMGRPVHTTVLEEGTYLLSSEDSCTLAGANGWSYTIGSSDEDTRVITEEFLLRGLNTTLRLPPTVAIPIVNWTSVRDLTDITGHRMPHLKKMLDIETLTSHDGYVSWFTLGSLVILLLIGAIYAANRKWKMCHRISFSGGRQPTALVLPATQNSLTKGKNDVSTEYPGLFSSEVPV